MSTEAMRLPFLRRPRLRWLLAAALVALLALVLPRFLALPAGPAVRGLVVKLPPSAPVSARAVRAAAATAIGNGLLALNLDAVRRRVEALAWVKRAEVRRRWPDALAIAVVPERPVARWGKHSLMDASGHVFTPAAEDLRGDLAGLPRLSGPEASAAALFGDFEQARARLAPLGLRLAALAANPRGEVSITLAGGTRIELGGEDPRAKLARFVTVAAPALATALARAATVDMRYPNGFAVGWKRKGQHG